MTARRLFNRLSGRAAALRRDEQGSIPMVMLIILVCVSLSAILVPSFIRLNSSTRSAVTRVRALHAAETGLQVGLGAVRSAATTSGQGDNTKLPCTGQLSGVVASGAAQYRVSMVYFDLDPRGKTASWRNANLISCGDLPSHTPSFVAMTSVGSNNAAFGGSGDRTLDATYAIRTNNQNIPGGLLQNYYEKVATYLALCMDAGSATPAAGTPLTVQTCQNNVPDRQKFSYRNNLSLVLNSTVTPTSAGMCLQADPGGSGTVLFEPCLASDSTSLYKQQWSFNDSAQFQSATSSGADLGNQCLDIQAVDMAGSNVILGGCGSYPQRQGSWLPSPASGAGMAGPNTNQLVNFKQFGRCLDLQSWGLSNPLIAWPCKQTPSGAPGWNQRWVYNSTTKTLSTDYSPVNSGPGNPTLPYCVKAPVSTASGTALRAYVNPCPDPSTPTPANMQWQSHTSVTDTYRDRYTYVDSSGRCLQPSTSDLYIDAGNSGNSAGNTSYVVVAPCDGSLLQKWNGDPNVLTGSPLRDANER